MHCKNIGPLILLLTVYGCASTEMYTYDGYLTKYGAKQTDAEFKAIYTECKRKYEVTSSERYICYRQLVPLKNRMDPAFGDLYVTYLTSAVNITKGFEVGNISKETTVAALDELRKDFNYRNSLLSEEYAKLVHTRNAREKQLQRQRMGMALNQVGTELMRQSSTDNSVTCTETVVGTVTCSEW